MKALLTIARKDLKLLIRNRAALFWVLGFPILMALFFGAIFSGGGGRGSLPIAVVDMDRTDYSRTLVSRLEQTEALRVRETTLDSATAAVRHGDLAAYVALRPGMSENFGFGGDSTSGIEIGIDPRQAATADMLRGLVTQAIFLNMRESFGRTGPGRSMIDRQLAKLEADTTGTPEHRARTSRVLRTLGSFMTTLDSLEAPAEGTLARGADTTAVADSIRAAASVGAGGAGGGVGGAAGRVGGAAGRAGTGGADSARAAQSGPRIRMVEVAESSDTPRSSFEWTFPSALAWGLIGTCMSFVISIVYERLTGTFLRLRLAPVSRAQVLAGKALACFLGCLVSTAVLLLIGRLLFHIRFQNPLELAAALAAAAFCFTGLMMLIASIGKTPQSVSGAGWAVMLVLSMTGGGMVPLIAMPVWMQRVSNFSLVKWAILGVEGAVWRGFGWAEMALPLGILVAAGIVTFTIGAVALSRASS
ncbi:MAG: ABC transporter permease [Bacteroidota bacterium]